MSFPFGDGTHGGLRADAPHTKPPNSRQSSVRYADTPTVIGQKHQNEDNTAIHDYGGDLERGLGSIDTNGEHRTSQEAINGKSGAATSGARRPSMFNRTFTQQIRNAGMDEGLNFKDLSKEDKRQVMMLPFAYLMDTSFKDGKHRHIKYELIRSNNE